MLKLIKMQGQSFQRLLIFLTGLVVVPLGTILVILFARGYRPNFKDRALQPTGLLVAHSYPDGAQIFVNSLLKSATNSTINLSPGTYAVEIKKESYHPWKKSLLVEPEIVTRATAVLFPTVPSLKAVTTGGASNPVLSPDGSKIVFVQNTGALSGLYSLDLNESPLGLLNREARLILTSNLIDFAVSSLSWSPDSRQILVRVPGADPADYLIDTGNPRLLEVTNSLTVTLESWQETKNLRSQQRLSSLSPLLRDLLESAAADLVWSPKEDKILYTATASATLPDNLVRPLPGSSSQPQERSLVPGTVYVYDVIEDRNFVVGHTSVPTRIPTLSPTPRTGRTSPTPTLTVKPFSPLTAYTHPSGLSWFPTSSHLLKIEGETVIIIEYDNQNPTIVYTGPMQSGLALPYPSGKQLLILANLNPEINPYANLYAVSLR